MFSKEFEIIRGLTDPFGSRHPILSRITQKYPYADDYACLAAARALLFNRLPENTEFELRYLTFVGWESGGPYTLENSYTVVNCTADSDTASTFISGRPEYTRLEKHEEYLSKWMSCKIFIHTETNSAVIFLTEADIRKVHMLMSLFPAYFKGLFAEKPLTEEEKVLCYSFTKRTSGDFETAIANIIHVNGIEAALNEELLTKFANVELERSIRNAEEQVNFTQGRLDENITEYRELVQQAQEARMTYESLMLRPKNSDTVLVDYFRHHKNLQLVSVIDDSIKFIVKTTLEWFDVNLYERMSSNESAYAFTAPAPFDSFDNRKLLMDSIFSDDPVFKIRLCSLYVLNEDVSVSRGYTYPENILREYIPNPHLHFHACLGSYRDPIREALRRGDYIAAIEQCVASCQSVNVAETMATFKPFMEKLFSSDCKSSKTLIDTNGKAYTPKEALAKLKKG